MLLPNFFPMLPQISVFAFEHGVVEVVTKDMHMSHKHVNIDWDGFEHMGEVMGELQI